MSIVIRENLNLTGMAKWLNEKFGSKNNGKPFNVQDVQQYIRLGHLPRYLGEYSIVRVPDIHSVNLYNIVKDEI